MVESVLKQKQKQKLKLNFDLSKWRNDFIPSDRTPTDYIPTARYKNAP